MTYGHKNGHRRCHNRYRPHKDRREDRQAQDYVVVKHPMIFQVTELALCLPCLEAGRTEMLIVELHITQCTQKPPATFTESDGLLLLMVEATGLAFDQQGFAGLARGTIVEQGGKDIYPKRVSA